MSSVFWLNNPAVLVDRNHITELWPEKNKLESSIKIVPKKDQVAVKVQVFSIFRVQLDALF